MVYLLVVLLFLSGCAPHLRDSTIDQYPQLIESEPLPPPPAWFHRNELILDLRVYVAADGSVRKIAWIESSNDKAWDALAAEAILKWKYMPAMESGRPVGIWVRHTVKVQFEEPITLPLAEIVCPNEAIADSVYRMVAQGADFGALARAVSIGPERTNGGSRGPTNIGIFSPAVREVLRRLREAEVTKPIPRGGTFVIYKRIGK